MSFVLSSLCFLLLRLYLYLSVAASHACLLIIHKWQLSSSHYLLPLGTSVRFSSMHSAFQTPDAVIDIQGALNPISSAASLHGGDCVCGTQWTGLA